ncbi:MAG TPA: heavy metal-associated domain-containing protein [Microbacteriaceae bacterium]|nr:heavy metal-associated domain-containing protein [Microbacteriaceae bacterium]
MEAHHDLGLTDRNANANAGGCCGGGGCACGSNAAASEAHAAPADIVLNVDGLTCGNCVNHVTSAVTDVSGVDSVEIELNAGGTSTVHIHSSGTVDLDAVRAAIVDAGYQPA